MNKNRPLSPHLTIYKLQITSGLSVFHRGTGAALALGVTGLIFLFHFFSLNLTSYSVYYLAYQFNALNHWFINLIFFGLLFSFCYHFSNGIRHLIWDAGYGFNLKELYTSGYIVIASSILLTFGIWFIL